MSEVKLMTMDGRLALPPSPATKAYFAGWAGDDDRPVVLIKRYDEGDCDTITNVRSKTNQANLRLALYDAREMGMLPIDCGYVLLPSGVKFEIDF